MPTLADHVARTSTTQPCLARVLVVHGELAPRLALRTLLEAGGYSVDVAGTPSEAMAKLDNGQYELVLGAGVHRVGGDVLAYARVKDYGPATARITFNETPVRGTKADRSNVAVRTEDVPMLLGKVADLISLRARRRMRQVRSGPSLRKAI